jgi:D-beta-D-heptose 7-phosphate kinase/D-beta-D-heptose 1-phosphate adenosyltransferase
MRQKVIYNDIHELARNLQSAKESYKGIVATSGGFDPLHVGHLRCLEESKTRSDELLVVIVNGDGFLTRKKGKPFMLLNERLEIIQALRCVDFAIGWDDGSQNIIGALEILRPHIFTKGGDRSSRNMVAEANICDKLGITIRYGVGGIEKIQSSSDLIKNS